MANTIVTSEKTPARNKDEEQVIEQVAPPVSTATVAAPEYDIPDGGYGWVCIACVATVNFNTCMVLVTQSANNYH